MIRKLADDVDDLFHGSVVQEHHRIMPRLMLRYALECLPVARRRTYFSMSEKTRRARAS